MGARDVLDDGWGSAAWDRLEKSWSDKSVWSAMLASRRVRSDVPSIVDVGGEDVGWGRVTVILDAG